MPKIIVNNNLLGTPYDFIANKDGSYTKILADIKNGTFLVSACAVEFIITTNSPVEYESLDLQSAAFSISSSRRIATDNPLTDIRYSATALLTIGDGTGGKTKIDYNDNICDKYVLEYEPGEVITYLGASPILTYKGFNVESIANPTTPVTYTVKVKLLLGDFTVPFSGKTFINITMPDV